MEDITGFVFTGLFSMLFLCVVFIFLLGIRLRQLDKKIKTLEDTMNITREEIEQILFRLNKLKPLIVKGEYK